jgi:hypothetical protein
VLPMRYVPFNDCLSGGRDGFLRRGCEAVVTRPDDVVCPLFRPQASVTTHEATDDGDFKIVVAHAGGQ